MRGVSGAQRQSVAAAAAAAVRVAAEVLQGLAEPTAVEAETKERLEEIKPLIKMRVAAGTEGCRANIPGARRKARNQAEHHEFGAGPGAWRCNARTDWPSRRGVASAPETASTASEAPSSEPVSDAAPAAAPVQQPVQRPVQQLQPIVNSQTAERVVEVPQVQTVEKFVDVPQVQIQEVVRQVPRAEFQEMLSEQTRQTATQQTRQTATQQSVTEAREALRKALGDKLELENSMAEKEEEIENLVMATVEAEDKRDA